MTREQAKKEALLLPLYDKDDCESVLELLDVIYDSLEQRNAELEQRVKELEEQIEKQYNQFMEAMK